MIRVEHSEGAIYIRAEWVESVRVIEGSQSYLVLVTMCSGARIVLNGDENFLAEFLNNLEGRR